MVGPPSTSKLPDRLSVTQHIPEPPKAVAGAPVPAAGLSGVTRSQAPVVRDGSLTTVQPGSVLKSRFTTVWLLVPTVAPTLKNVVGALVGSETVIDVVLWAEK